MVKNIKFLISGSLLLALFLVMPAVHNAAAKTAVPQSLIIQKGFTSEKNNTLIQNLTAQVQAKIDYTIDKTSNILSFISSENGRLPLQVKPKTSDPIIVASQFMSEYGRYFGLQNPAKELHLINTKSDALGMHHVRYSQEINHIPVFGAQTIVHLNSDLSVASANGNTVPDVAINTTPLITKDMAIRKADELWTQQSLPFSPLIVEATLQIFNLSLINKQAESNNHLVWLVELYKKFPQGHEYYFIDAHDGQVVFQITGIQKAISRRIYDCSVDGVNCYLDSNYYFPVINYLFGRSEGVVTPRGANPLVGGTDVDDLYDLAGATHAYYTTLGRDGANNQGGLGDGISSPVTKTDVFSYIDYVTTGVCPNAYFDGYSINFCKGLEATDVAAHEYGHAVDLYAIEDASHNPAGLTYSYEPGALNESYADIFGEAVENYSTGTSDWLIGEDVDVTGLKGPLRSMSNPASLSGSFGVYPDRFYGTNYYCLTGDGGGVHHNSSVPNHAAYLMAMGGSFNGCSITGIGKAKEEAIFYRALTTYLTPSSGFNAAYTALNTSCADLYGATSSDCINTQKALQAVEMDQAGACSAVARVTPGCSLPSAASVTSATADGYYNAGKTIDITVNFDGAITGAGTVTFDSGGTCAITVSNATTASCTYTVLAGENSADLNVTSINGTFANSFADTVTALTPTTTLAAGKNIIVDTTAPTGTLSINSGATYTSSASVTLALYASDTNHVPQMRFSNDNLTWSVWESPAWTKTWPLSPNRGAKTVYVQYTDSAGNITTVTANITYLKPASIVTGPGPGVASLLKAFSYAGKLQTAPKNLYAFSKSYKEGMHLAACDVDGDGVDEIVTAVGPNQSPWVKVFRKNGQVISKFLAYAADVKGGVFIACGDLNGDGKGEIVTGVPEGYNPRVRTFNGVTGKPIISNGFLAYSKTLQTGIRVATGDVDGDGLDEIIVGTGNGAAPRIRIFSGKGVPKPKLDFYAYSKNERGGINVAAGDVNGDGIDEVITGSPAGKTGEVKIFTPTGRLLKKFNAYSASYKLGVKVSSGDVNADGTSEIIIGTETGGSPRIRVLKMNGQALGDFYPYDKNVKNGVETTTAYFEK